MEKIFESLNRRLKDITDGELAVVVDLSGHYGVKGFWENPVVTRVDRDMFRNVIVIDFDQKRAKDGVVSKSRMFFDYVSLKYHTDMREPFHRTTSMESVTANTQMFLWLIAQGFDLFESLTQRTFDPVPGNTSKVLGYAVGEWDDEGPCDGIEYFSRCDEYAAVRRYVEKGGYAYKIVEMEKDELCLDKIIL